MPGGVIISEDVDTPLQSIIIHDEDGGKNNNNNEDDCLQSSLESMVCDALHISLELFGDMANKTLLVRSTTDDVGRTIPGLHAYHFHHPYAANLKPNIRATRLAMALGLYRNRFYGTVVLVRESSSKRLQQQQEEKEKVTASSCLLLRDTAMACNVTPDLRHCILTELLLQVCDSNTDNDTPALHQGTKAMEVTVAPEWMANAAMNSYHDDDALSLLSAVMKRNDLVQQDDDDDDDDINSTKVSKNHDQDKPVVAIIGTTNDINNDDSSSSSTEDDDDDEAKVDRPQPRRRHREFVAKSPLCFHCRGPAESLCPDCHAVYFCNLPRTCRTECWSHDCQCPTWRLYERRRTVLSTLPLGPWHQELMTRDFQLSSLPYEQFLVEKLKVIIKNTEQAEETTGEGSSIDTLSSSSNSSWWMTELDHGWSGGQSNGAKTIDVEQRCSFRQGFHPIVDFPPDRPVSHAEREQRSCKRNEVGWLCLHSWRDYYKLRGIAESSPVALLLTFPLTLYYGITEYGQVPCTVARMLKRPLRIHVVGVEKELKLLDLFKEVSYLIPPDFSLELVFIVREDMLPESLKKGKHSDSKGVVVKLCDNLCVFIVSGTYGNSIDPNFDCGTGAPDIVMAFNAGLYAYSSWRSVIRFLDVHRGVVGIFTDYNEYSGLGCASLGGAKSRESLCVNPFRQPRAMPVYSMNLPQFSNGFIYVFNQQELE